MRRPSPSPLVEEGGFTQKNRMRGESNAMRQDRGRSHSLSAGRALCARPGMGAMVVDALIAVSGRVETGRPPGNRNNQIVRPRSDRKPVSTFPERGLERNLIVHVGGEILAWTFGDALLAAAIEAAFIIGPAGARLAAKASLRRRSRALWVRGCASGGAVRRQAPAERGGAEQTLGKMQAPLAVLNKPSHITRLGGPVGSPTLSKTVGALPTAALKRGPSRA